MNGAECIIKAAKDSGLEVCFANPGTTELPLVVALDTIGGIRPVLGLFEGVCTGAADGYARMLQKPAMALLHLGPGLANGISNLHNAKRAHSRLVTVVGEHSTWHRAYDPPLAMDIESLARTVSGWHRTCSSSDLLSQDISDAIEAANTGRIATLIVPYDLQMKKCRDSTVIPYMQERKSASRDAVESAAGLLRGAGKPAVVLGNNVLDRKGLMVAARIKQSCGCDLLAESFPAHIERGAGLPEVNRIPYLPEPAMDMLSKYDALVFIGAREPVSFFGYEGIPGCLLRENQKSFLLVKHDQDAMDALDSLADALGAPVNIDPALLAPSNRPALPSGPLSADRICSVIAAIQPEGAIVVEEAITTGLMYYPVTSGVPPFSLLTLTGGSLGQGAPCAAGAAVACPDRPVINFQADGAGMYTIQALWTEAREGLNVKTLICSNRSYDILKLELARLGVVSPGKNTAHLTDLAGIDWVDLGKGMGVPSVKVSTAEELAKELGKALQEQGPNLIQMVM
jgi:acetolactate synthase-1/2/3 large subunit